MKAKYIKINFINFEKKIENSIVEISIKKPEDTLSRKMYYYELENFPEIIGRINRDIENRIRFCCDIYEDLYIKIDNKIYNDLIIYLQEKTDYEETALNDDIALLMAVVNMYRNDIKTWEVADE